MKKLIDVDTVLTADSVEWCPSSELEDILACGTYQLNQEENLRVGSLTLYKWDDGGAKLDRVLENESDKFSFGILDMKWKPSGEKGLLSMATSHGTVCFLTLEQLERGLELKNRCEVKLSLSEDVDSLHLCLSIDWNRTKNLVAVSDSLGQVGLVEWCEGGELKINQLWKAHRFEAWIVCFGHEDDTIFSGGDDNVLHRWDLRVGSSKPCFSSRWHKMGVCSLQAHPNIDNILGSGSYDEQFAIWDVRNMSKPLKDISLGGGIWRIKWNTFSSDYAAAACMHNHFSVVKTHLKSPEPIEMVDVYEKHESLAYGIDWCRKIEHDVHTLASCSFYDHSLHLWKLPISAI